MAKRVKDEQEQFWFFVRLEMRIEAHAKKGLKYFEAGKIALARAELKKGDALKAKAKKFERSRDRYAP